MKRALFVIIVFFLLGAVLNVAVAWAIALASLDSSRSGTMPLTPQAAQWWSNVVPDDFPESPDEMYVTYGFGIQMWVLSDASAGAPPDHMALRFLYGWPVQSLEWTMWQHGSKRSHEYLHVYVLTGWPFAKPGLAKRLPFMPVWPGFAINALLYGGLCWVMFLGLLRVRWIVRIKRGKCPRCAYDLRGSDSTSCPECGWARSIRAE